MWILLIILLALVVLGFGVALAIAYINAGVLVGKSHLINPTDSPEEAKARGLLIEEADSGRAALRFRGFERKVGRVWLEHLTHYESTLLGFGARQQIDPGMLLVMTVEESSPFELMGAGVGALRIDGREPRLQWSSGLPGFVKAALHFEGEVPPAVAVATGGGSVRIEIPGRVV